MDDFTTAPASRICTDSCKARRTLLSRQADGVVDVADDRAEERQAVHGPRNARRCDDPDIRPAGFLNVVVYNKSLYDAVAAPRWHHQDCPKSCFTSAD